MSRRRRCWRSIACRWPRSSRCCAMRCAATSAACWPACRRRSAMRDDRIAVLDEVLDYTRECSPADLVAWLEAEIAAERRRACGGEPVAIGSLRLDPELRAASANGRLVRLTPAEVAALALLMRRHG